MPHWFIHPSVPRRSKPPRCSFLPVHARTRARASVLMHPHTHSRAPLAFVSRTHTRALLTFSYEFFRDFVGRLHSEGGVDRFVVHARKALLSGLPADADASVVKGIASAAAARRAPGCVRVCVCVRMR